MERFSKKIFSLFSSIPSKTFKNFVATRCLAPYGGAQSINHLSPQQYFSPRSLTISSVSMNVLQPSDLQAAPQVYTDITSIPPKPDRTTRFVCMSDTHTWTSFDFTIPNGDVFIHSGDLTTKGKTEESLIVLEWLKQLPHKTKIVIAGNHDVSFDESFYEQSWSRFHGYKEDTRVIKQAYRSARSSNVIYLEDETYELPTSEGGWKIYGSPWQPTFFNWGFNLDRGEPISKAWAAIPDDTHILVTHGPPHQILDLAAEGDNAGCEELLKRLKIVRPLLHVFGHIHEGYGSKVVDGTTFVNASTCTRNYKPFQHPFVVDLSWDLKKD